jgi:hypothetical protein
MYQSQRKPIEPDTPKKVSLVEVIEVVSFRGNGVDSVYRPVVQYYSKDGKLLAERDDG